jgi:membrane-associated phospholipid phosphatase
MNWENTDKAFFVFINQHMQNDWFDLVMPFVRNPFLWAPLYVFMLLYVATNFEKNRKWWALFFILLPMLTDYVSSNLIKENIYRLRPCNDLEMAQNARFLLNYRPQSSSFTSSHATSHFALAAFFFNTLKPRLNNFGYLFYLWAFVICYAQVYVGVHYPLDVICGGLLGYFIGKWFSLYFNKKFQLT